ncbi:MAG TPA: nuclear transport factor 2 family protein [Solirubrobacteraceae bacterium]
MEERCAAVRAWFDALNRRDWDAMLALASPGLVFEPVRAGDAAQYEGHAGVRRYLREVAPFLGASRVAIEHVAAVSAVRAFARGQVVGAGIEFISVHDFDEAGRFTAIRQYVGSDEETLRRLGRL